jgi:hypothetical protein
VGQSEGSEPSRLRKLRPYERSRCAEHGGSCNALGVCVSHRGQSWSHPSRSRATQDAKPRPVYYGAVSRSMRSTSSRGMWIAPANLSALSTPRSTISSTVVGVRPRYSAASHMVTFMRFLSSTLLTSQPGKDWGRDHPEGYPSPSTSWRVLSTYTQVMAAEDTVLEEAMDNLKEAGQRIRATQSLMRSQGMTDGENYRELHMRLSTALATTEAAYLEARRRRNL